MTIHILYFDDCPNYVPALALVRRTLDELGVEADIELVYVDSIDSADANRFLGSPTIQVNGIDIDPAAKGRDDFGLSCRMYGCAGVPPRDMIVAALKGRNGGSH